MHMTPEIVEACYELLRMTSPFKRHKLPHADAVKFSILKTRQWQGDFQFEPDGTPHIRISYRKHKTLAALIETLAHEMCHQCDKDARSDHGASFNKLADQVCRVHGFDRGQF